MTPEEFIDKANAAAILHNMGVINRRTGKATEAIQSFEAGLDLYNECLVYYNSLEAAAGTAQKGIATIAISSPEGKTDGDTSTATGVGGAPICLELKIAQTLQSMARLYTKSLNDSYSAIKAHEDAITLVVEGKFVQDEFEVAVDSYQRHKENRNQFVYDSPQRQERISRHSNLYNEYSIDHPHHHNKKNDIRTPTSVIANYDLSTTSSPEDTNHNRKPDITEYNVVKLTQHERLRVITTSLNALAKIYVKEEIS